MPPSEGLAATDSQEEGSSQHQPQTQAQSVPQARSWAKVAQQSQKVLTRYDVKVKMEGGVRSVEIPEEVFEDPSPLWDDFLIGKFLEKAPHIGKVHAIVNKIWTGGDKSQMIEVFEINATTMKFRILNSAMRTRILRRCMWNLAEVPVIMTEWKPMVEEKEPEQEVPLWVHLRNVPMNMFSWKGLSFVTSPVGVPLKLHQDTALCKDFKVAKVFVKADLTKELPRSMIFKFQGKDTLVDFSYPWLPSKCTTCGKWGHLEKVCKQKAAEETGNVMVTQDTTSEETVKENCSLEKENNSEVSERSTSATVKETEVLAVTALEENAMNVTEAEEEIGEGTGSENETLEGEEKAWSTPTKVSRTPEKKTVTESNEDSILSNSRFAILAPEDGEILQQVTQTEDVPATETSQSEKNGNVKVMGSTRPSLPRHSKDHHRVIPNSAAQKTNDCGHSLLNKQSTRKKN
ncbi:hypothetical protein Bca4012_011843 [Brassica carinata]